VSQFLILGKDMITYYKVKEGKKYRLDRTSKTWMAGGCEKKIERICNDCPMSDVSINTVQVRNVVRYGSGEFRNINVSFEGMKCGGYYQRTILNALSEIHKWKKL